MYTSIMNYIHIYIESSLYTYVHRAVVLLRTLADLCAMYVHMYLSVILCMYVHMNDLLHLLRCINCEFEF